MPRHAVDQEIIFYLSLPKHVFLYSLLTQPGITLESILSLRATNRALHQLLTSELLNQIAAPKLQQDLELHFSKQSIPRYNANQFLKRAVCVFPNYFPPNLKSSGDAASADANNTTSIATQQLVQALNPQFDKEEELSAVDIAELFKNVVRIFPDYSPPILDDSAAAISANPKDIGLIINLIRYMHILNNCYLSPGAEALKKLKQIPTSRGAYNLLLDTLDPTGNDDDLAEKRLGEVVSQDPNFVRTLTRAEKIKNCLKYFLYVCAAACTAYLTFAIAYTIVTGKELLGTNLFFALFGISAILGIFAMMCQYCAGMHFRKKIEAAHISISNTNSLYHDPKDPEGRSSSNSDDEDERVTIIVDSDSESDPDCAEVQPKVIHERTRLLAGQR